MDHRDDARRAAEAAARESYGRLVAYLSARSRDVAAAEDALGDAFRAALETWPQDGVPSKPEAWLLAVARRRMIDDARHERVKENAAPGLRLAADRRQAAAGAGEDEVFPDERLKLMFVCAHPAIDAGARAPLMLQAILGLDAARIASSFLVGPAAMGQRLVRAKARIRDAGIPFEVPGPDDLPARLDPVLDAIYAAYGAGWEDVAGVDPRRRGLAEEAIWLARILVRLVPDEPEARGLLALLLHCEARRAARRAADGAYIPLTEQDVALWSRPMIDEAERELSVAAGRRAIGRFQLEAAIQSAHAQRAIDGRTDWEAIALLYEGLVRLSPSLGARVGRAAALAGARGPGRGLEALDAIDSRSVLTYQPYWAVRAHVLARLGRPEAAREAYSQAIGLAEDPAVREFLVRSQLAIGDGAKPAG
jgi:RNA polymerase sigma-70 factor (ECF subfamily)